MADIVPYYELIVVDTPIKLEANIVHALPGAATLITWQSAAGSDMLGSVDGIVFGSLGVSLANEPKAVFTAAAYVKTATANTWIIAKVAPISALSQAPGGGGGGGGEQGALHPDGTIALPGIAFTNETDLGFYRPSADVISLANNSAVELSVNGITHVVALQNLAAQVRVSIGTIPALSGALRLANQGTIMARNAANTADISLLSLSGTNTVLIGQNATPITVLGNTTFEGQIALGVNAYLLAVERVAPPATPANSAYIWLQDNGSNQSQLMIRFFTGQAIAIATEGQDYISVGQIPAQSGSVRLTNPGSIKVRNVSNTADINLISATGDVIQLGDTNFPMTVNSVTTFANDTIFNDISTFNQIVNFNNSAVFNSSITFSQPIAFSGEYIAIGTNPAQSGVVRVPNNTFFKWRNAANTADLTILWADASNQVALNWAQPSILYVGGSAINMTATAGPVNINPYLTINGGVPASTGAIRFAVGQQLTSRNGANTGDLNIIGFDGSSVVLNSPGTGYQTFIYSWLGMEEATPAGFPPPNRAFIYLQDRGGGKTALMIQFGSGNPIPIAQES